MVAWAQKSGNACRLCDRHGRPSAPSHPLLSLPLVQKLPTAPPRGKGQRHANRAQQASRGSPLRVSPSGRRLRCQKVIHFSRLNILKAARLFLGPGIRPFCVCGKRWGLAAEQTVQD